MRKLLLAALYFVWLIREHLLRRQLLNLSKIILLVTKFDTRFLVLVLAIMDLSDQDLNTALEEFESTMVDVSDRFILVAIGKPLQRPNYNLCGC